MRLMQLSGTRDDEAEGLLLGEKLGHRMGQRARVVQRETAASIWPYNTLAQDVHVSSPTGREKGHAGAGPDKGGVAPTSQRSGMGPLHTRRGQAEDQGKASWRTRAGAIGGASAASFRCWRLLRITSLYVMTAMMRSDPRRHRGKNTVCISYPLR